MRSMSCRMSLFSACGIVGPPEPVMARRKSWISTDITSAFVNICEISESLHMSLASAIAKRANIHAHCSIS
jgi:hypothetical protein